MSDSTRSLSIQEWVKLAEQNIDIPVRISLHGISMEPLVCKDRDFVTIIPMKRDLLVGDIVLFADMKRDRYVVHRVWKLTDDSVCTWGDNCYNADGWFPKSAIKGLVIKVEKAEGKIIHTDTEYMRKLGIKKAQKLHASLNRKAYLRGKLNAVKRIFTDLKW